MTREEIEAALADGTLERGITRRYARGTGTAPSRGHLLLPDQVDSVHPPVRGREVVGWLVTGEPAVATLAEIRWGVPVVGVARRGMG